MKIIITGGRGFIGSNLVKILNTKRYIIRVLTRKNSFEKDKIEYREVDYHNKQSIKKAIEGFDVVIHLAATLFARNRKEYIYENVETTKNLIDMANENKIKRFIYISSLAAAGPSSDAFYPKTENDPDTPVSAYGLSKLLAEKEVLKFNHDWIILRPPIVYGPKDDGFSTIAEWVRKGIMISPSSKDARFSFIYVNDLCNCITRAIEDESIKNEKYYVCERNNYTWHEFISIMAEEMKLKKPKIIKMPKTLLNITATGYEIFSYIFNTKPVLNRDKVKEATTKHWIANPKKWEEKTNYTNWTNIYEGLKQTFSNLV